MQDPKAFIPQRPMKPTKDDVLATFIRQITSDGPIDQMIFRKIRNFYFDMPPNEFEQYAKKPHNQLISTLSFQLLHPQTDQTKIPEYKKKITNILSLLAFLNYKFTDLTSMEIINLIAKQIKVCHHKELCLYLKIVRNSFENHEKDFEKANKLASDSIFHAICQRIDDFLDHFETLQPDEFFPLITIITILLTCVKSVELMKSIFQKLQPKLEKILNYQIPDDFTYAKRATIQLLKVKCGILMGNVSLNNTNNPQTANLIVNTYMDILMQNSGVASSLVDETINSFTYIFKQDQARRIDIIAKHFPTLTHYKYYNSENFVIYHSLIQNILEYAFKRDRNEKITREPFLVSFCKYDAGVLHFSMVQYSSSNFRFGQLMQYIRFPNDDQHLTACLFTLFFNSIDTGFVEMAASLANLKSSVSKSNAVTQVLMQLSNFADCYYRLLKYFQSFLMKLFPQDESEKRQLHKQISTNLSLIDIDILYSCFRHALIFTMKFRSMLHHGSELLHIPSPVGDPEKNLKQCTQTLESAKKFSKIRQYHFSSAKELVRCLSMTTPFMMENIWDYFFQDFFGLEDEVIFDSFLFKELIRDNQLTETFINSLVKYSLKELKNGYQIKHLIRSLSYIFEKLVQKPPQQLINAHRPQEPQYQPQPSPDFIKNLSISANRFLEVCKDLSKSNVYCPDVLSLIKSYYQFMEYILGQNNNPLKISDSLVSDICSNADNCNCPSKNLCEFIEFSQNLQKDFLKLRAVLSSLINALKNDIKQPLALLKQCFERYESNFLSHPMIPQFYSTLLVYLDNSPNEIRQEIVNFIKNIPKNIIEEVIFPVSSVYNNKTIVLDSETKQIRVDFDSFLHGLNCAMSEYPSIDKLWEITKQIIIDVLNQTEWTSDMRKNFQTLIFFILPMRQKNQNQCDDVLKTIIQTFNENISALAHVFTALCSCFQDPPHHLLNSILLNLNTKEKMSLFINEIAFISSLQVFPSKGVSETICHLIISEVKKELIDPITFAMFVHRTINELNGSDWKDVQRWDSFTNFIELDFVPRSLQKIIVFARDLLGEYDGSIMKILDSMRISSAFFSILVQSELISKCKYTQEVKDFIQECFEDEMMEQDYGLFRFLGPLFRAFPDALPDFKEKVHHLLMAKLQTIISSQVKVQGTYLVLLVPVLDSNLFDISEFSSTISIIHKFMDHPNTFLKCQAQLAAQIFAKKGSEEVKNQFNDIVQTKLKEAHFYNLEKSPNKLTLINWKDLKDVLFSYYLIVPEIFIQTITKQLEYIPTTISENVSQNLSAREMIAGLKSLCGFIATGSVVNLLLNQNKFLEIARLFVSIFNAMPLIPRQDFVEIMIDYFSFAPQLFPEFFKQSMSEPKSLQFLCIISQNEKSKPLFQSVEEPLLPIIKESLKVKDKMTNLQSMLSYIVCSLNSAKYDSELIELLEKIFHEMLNCFDNNFALFSSVIFQKLLEFFGLNHPKVLLQLAFHVLEIRNPLLVTQYAQTYSKLLSSEVLSPELFYSIEYSEDMRLNSLFFNIFLLPYVQAHNDQLSVIVNFAKEKFNLYVYVTFLNTLYDKNVTLNNIEFNPFELYNEATDDATRLQVLLLWSYSNKTTENFVTMFSHFIEFVHNSLPLEIRQICSILKIPLDLSDDDLKIILYQIGEIIKDYSRYSNVLLSIFKLVISNVKNMKKHPLTLFHFPLQEHALYIEFGQKKITNGNQFNIFIELTNLIEGGTPEEEVSLANHFASFALKQIQMNKDQPQFFYKAGMNIFPPLFKLIKSVNIPSFVSEILQFIIDVHNKTQNPPPPPPPQQLTAQNPQLAAQQQQIKQQQQQIPQNNLWDAIQLQIVRLMPDMIEHISKTTHFPFFDKILEMLVHITCNDSNNWSYCLTSLHYIIESKLYGQKALELMYSHKSLEKLQTLELDKLQNTENDLIARLFPILWVHPPTIAFRTNFLLPFAAKFCRVFNQDVPIIIFQANSIMLYVLEHPFDNSPTYLLDIALENLSKLNQIDACSYNARFIIQSFSMEHLTNTMRSVLMNFLSVPKIASAFFQMCPASLKEKILPNIPLGVKFFSMFRIYPKLDDKVMDLINTLEIHDLLTRCANSELWQIPFSYLFQKFLGDIKLNDMLKISQHIPPEQLAKLCKTIDFTKIDKILEKNLTIKFEVGPGDLQRTISETSWEDAITKYGGDFEYSKEEVALKPLLRFRQGYEVTEKEMVGFVPQISYEMAKRILKPPELLSDKALEFINDHKILQNFQRDISIFSQSNNDRLTKNSLKDYLVANELSNIQNYFKYSDKNQRSNMIFFSLVLTQNDPPILHKTYENIRKTVLESFNNIIEMNLSSEEVHKVTFSESMRLNSVDIPSYRTDDLLSAKPNDVEALLCQLLIVSKQIDVNDAFISIIKGALRTIPTSDILFSCLALIVDKLELCIPAILESAVQIPVRWASIFSKLIGENKKLTPLTKLLPKSTGIYTLFNNCEFPIDLKKKLISFINPVKQMLESPRAKMMKKVVDQENKILEMIFEGKSDENLIKESEEILLESEESEKQFYNSFCLGEYSLDSMQSPFVDDITGNALQLTGYVKNTNSRAIYLDVLTTTGSKISYVLYPSKSVDYGFTTFMTCLSTILQRCPATFMRNIQLPNIMSVEIGDGFVLSKTPAEPLVPSFCLKSLLDSKENMTSLKQIKKGVHEYTSKKSYCDYFTTMAGRYAAFCAVQTFFEGNVNPLSMFVDLQSPFVWGERPNKEKDFLLRLRGKMASLMDEALVKGSFRSSFIATADAIVSNASNVLVLMKSTMNLDENVTKKFVEEARNHSTRSDNTDETQQKINNLIAAAMGCEDIRFTPWL